MELFWSMQLAKDRLGGHSVFSKTGALPNSMRFKAEVDGYIIAHAQLERRFLAPGTQIRDRNAAADAEAQSNS
jgi:hypothetical protein